MVRWMGLSLVVVPLVVMACSGTEADDSGTATDTDTDTVIDTDTFTDTDTDTDTPTGTDTEVQVRFNWFNPRGGDVPDSWYDGDVNTTWPTVYEQTDTVSFYISGMADDARGNMTLAVQFLTAHGIAVAVEGGGTLSSEGCDDQTGERSAATELAKVQTVYDAGGTLGYLSMDGPLSRTLATGRSSNCGFELATAVTELVDYVAAVRRERPEIQIGWAINFPNWTYGGIAAYQCATKDHGDLEVAIEAVLSALADAGEHLDYIMADNPYDYAVGQKESNCFTDPTAIDWMGRIVALEEQVVAAGLPFALIYNSATGGTTSNELFHDDTVAFVEAYQQAGGNPTIRHVESWYSYPDTMLPETEDDTLTNTVRDSYAVMSSRME